MADAKPKPKRKAPLKPYSESPKLSPVPAQPTPAFYKKQLESIKAQREHNFALLEQWWQAELEVIRKEHRRKLSAAIEAERKKEGGVLKEEIDALKVRKHREIEEKIHALKKSGDNDLYQAEKDATKRWQAIRISTREKHREAYDNVAFKLQEHLAKRGGYGLTDTFKNRRPKKAKPEPEPEPELEPEPEPTPAAPARRVGARTRPVPRPSTRVRKTPASASVEPDADI